MTAAVSPDRHSDTCLDGDLRNDLRAVALPWLSARMIVVASWVLAEAMVRIGFVGNRPEALDRALLGWDAAWYRDIVRVGYGGLPDEALRFFPLHPMLSVLVERLTPLRSGAAVLFTANAAGLALLVLVRRLVIAEWGDRALAQRSVWLVSLSPAGFVLVWGYAEPLMMACAVGFLLLVSQRRWAWAGALGAAAALARPLGLFLAAAAIVEVAAARTRLARGPGFIVDEIEADGLSHHGTSGAANQAPVARRWAGQISAVVGPVCGLAAYLGWVGLTRGDPSLPAATQGEFRGDAVDPVTRFVDGVAGLWTDGRTGDVAHLPWALGLVGLLWLASRWLPLSHFVFSVLVVVAALSADNLNSLQRYGLNAVPLTLAASHWLGEHEHWQRPAIVVSAMTMGALSTASLLGRFVP